VTRLLILCPQGGRPEAEFNAAMADAIQKRGSGQVAVSVACLRKVDGETIRKMAPSVRVLGSFEEFRDASDRIDIKSEALRLARDYPSVNWWSIAIAERHIVDASFLLGGAGHSPESQEFVEALVVDSVRYFEDIFRSGQFSAVVAGVADTLIIHVFYQVARRFGVRALALSPNAWIREDGKPGLYIGRDEYLHSDRMEALYSKLSRRSLTDAERQRVEAYKRAVSEFNMAQTYTTIMKRPFVVSALSPNVKRLWRYLRDNAARRKEIEYYKIDVSEKTRANVLRIWRRWRSKHMLGATSLDIPQPCVFFPMQYQPEQTTLVGGLYFANQVSVIENIAKALPFGHTLVIKEHPRGRGARPVWQYRHLQGFPNIRFCDAGAKEIMQQSGAVITITSTVGLEAMAMDKPIIVLGDVYYDFAEAVYKPKSWSELAQTLRRILIDREYEKNTQRHAVIDRFFLAYLMARVPGLLTKEGAPAIAEAVCNELGVANEALARAV